MSIKLKAFLGNNSSGLHGHPIYLLDDKGANVAIINISIAPTADKVCNTSLCQAVCRALQKQGIEL